MKKRIILRADGDSTIGLGHVYRLLSLADMLKGKFDTVFITKKNRIIKKAAGNKTNIIFLEKYTQNEEADYLFNNFPPTENIIVLDGYQFNSSYQKILKKLNYTIVYIDDLCAASSYADIIINHSPYIPPGAYKNIKNYSKVYQGTHYALLRKKFIDYASQKQKIKKTVAAFVCFGGADPKNLTKIAIESFLQQNEIKKIHVVIGAAYKHKISHLKKAGNRIKIYQNLNGGELLSVMKKCQIAMAPSSTICYELCCVKMPIISGYYIANQKNIYKGLKKEKCIIGIDDFSKTSSVKLAPLIKKLINSDVAKDIIKHQHKLFDGKNRNRFLNLFEKLC